MPHALIWLVPKGHRDCGAHEWYRHDETIDRCYHCYVGCRCRCEIGRIPRPRDYAGFDWSSDPDAVHVEGHRVGLVLMVRLEPDLADVLRGYAEARGHTHMADAVRELIAEH